MDPIPYLGTTAPISFALPTAEDIKNDQLLLSYLQSREDVFESDEGLKRRSDVTNKVSNIMKEWAKYLGQQKQLPEEIYQDGGGIQLKIFGSTRLGVHTPDADIDILCIAPSFVTRGDFFSSFIETLSCRSDTSMISAVPEAYTPVLKFNIDNQAIDMIFAMINLQHLPPDVDVLDSFYLRGLDEHGIRSLNGSRVAEQICRLVPNYSTFCMTLRVVKHWARQRGLYSNVLGFLGGVNLAILVAFVCQRYVNACPATLVKKFFLMYTMWRWPNPILLTRIEDRSPLDNDGRYIPVWNPKVNPKDGQHIMPIITPSYPAMNSAYNVGLPQFRYLQEEFQRGQLICQSFFNRSNPDPISRQTLCVEDNDGMQQMWRLLCAPAVYDFFQKHSRYLMVDVSALSAKEHRSWFGWVESRLRSLIISLEQPPSIFCHPQANCFHRRICIPAIRNPSEPQYDMRDNNQNDESKSFQNESTPVRSSQMDIDTSYTNQIRNDDDDKSSEKSASTTISGSELTLPDDLQQHDNNISVEDNQRTQTTYYISTFFIGLSFRQGLRNADITPAVQDFIYRINNWENRKYGMEISVKPCRRDEIPEFVYETRADPSSIRGCTPAKTNTASNRNTDMLSPVFSQRINILESSDDHNQSNNDTTQQDERNLKSSDNQVITDDSNGDGISLTNITRACQSAPSMPDEKMSLENKNSIKLDIMDKNQSEPQIEKNDVFDTGDDTNRLVDSSNSHYSDDDDSSVNSCSKRSSHSNGKEMKPYPSISGSFQIGSKQAYHHNNKGGKRYPGTLKNGPDNRNHNNRSNRSHPRQYNHNISKTNHHQNDNQRFNSTLPSLQIPKEKDHSDHHDPLQHHDSININQDKSNSFHTMLMSKELFPPLQLSPTSSGKNKNEFSKPVTPSKRSRSSQQVIR